MNKRNTIFKSNFGALILKPRYYVIYPLIRFKKIRYEKF